MVDVTLVLSGMLEYHQIADNPSPPINFECKLRSIGRALDVLSDCFTAVTFDFRNYFIKVGKEEVWPGGTQPMLLPE